MIPAPPSEQNLVNQLPEIMKVRRADVFTPSELKSIDRDMRDLFDQVIIEGGYPSEKASLTKIANDLRPFIKSLKDNYRQPRPWQIARKYGVEFDYTPVRSAQTFAYPSGHTIQAHYLAGVLSRKYPELADQLLWLARRIELSRLALGVHFPTDNAAGRMVAQDLLNSPSALGASCIG